MGVKTINGFPKAITQYNLFERSLKNQAPVNITRRLLDLSSEYFYYDDGDLFESHRKYSNIESGEIAFFIPNGYVDHKGKLWTKGYTNVVYELGVNPITKDRIFKKSNPKSQRYAIDYAFDKHKNEIGKDVMLVSETIWNLIHK